MAAKGTPVAVEATGKIECLVGAIYKKWSYCLVLVRIRDYTVVYFSFLIIRQLVRAAL